MKTPINFQDYLNFRKDQVAHDMYRVLYNDLSHLGKCEIDDEVGGEYIKIFNLLYN
jgi:hypothetical protein